VRTRALVLVGMVGTMSLAAAHCGGSPSAPSAPAQSVLAFSSEPGDYIGGGRRYTFTDETATFRHAIDPPYPGSIVINVLSKDLQSYWTVAMAAPAGQELAVGSYQNASDWSPATSSRPRFSLSGDGRGCGGSEAQFSVLELVRGASVLVTTGAMVSTISRLHVQFTQRCTATSAPGLTGELWFIATAGP
jgi:hypothetical protein